MIGAMFGIASVAGPLMGGVFTEQLTWRWCFYINLPIGAITIVSVAFLVKIDQKYPAGSVRERLAGIDFIGAAFLLPAVICLLLALQFGGTKYAWGSSKIIGLFVGFGVLAIIFAFIQWKRGDRATMPPRVLAHRTVWAACIFAMFFAGRYARTLIALTIVSSFLLTTFQYTSRVSKVLAQSTLAFSYYHS